MNLPLIISPIDREHYYLFHRYKPKGEGCEVVSCGANREEIIGDIILPDKVTENGKTYSILSLRYQIVRPKDIRWKYAKKHEAKDSYRIYGAFAGCSELTSITLPKNIICAHDFDIVFDGCTSLKRIIFQEGSTYLSISKWPLKELVLPEGLTKVRIFDSPLLESIYIPSTLIDFNGHSVWKCPNLKQVFVAEDNKSLCDIDGIVYDYDLTKVVFIPSALEYAHLVDGITTIDETCFEISGLKFAEKSKNSKLSYLYLPQSIKQIASNTFEACPNIKDISIPLGVCSWLRGKINIHHIGEDLNDEKETGNHITYIVDGKTFFIQTVDVGERINPIPFPQKTAHIFEGWSFLPKTMPDACLYAYGSFKKESYLVTYVLEDKPFETIYCKAGELIPDLCVPDKEGFSFYGWDMANVIMPNHNIRTDGYYVKNKYTLKCLINGKPWKELDFYYNDRVSIQPPHKEHYRFSGWDKQITKMPANDVCLDGHFTPLKYRITYMINGYKYGLQEIEYDDIVNPLDFPESQGTIWEGLPLRMVGKDIVVHLK